MFFVRYQDTVGGPFTTISLLPPPTEVEYPDARLFKTQSSQDGAVVLQRPLRDDRHRKWIWKGFRDSDAFAAYRNLWITLQSLEYRTRLKSQRVPEVYVWENETGIGGFDRVDGSGNKIWTKVKFIQVQRTIRPGGGRVIYDTSTVEFVIADDTYTAY